MEQVHGDPRTLALRKRNMSDRLEEVEGTINKILGKLDANETPERAAIEALRKIQLELQSPPSGGPTSAFTASDGTIPFGIPDSAENTPTRLDNAPLLSLFENLVFTREENLDDSPESATSSLADHITARNERILGLLRTLTPSRAALRLILQSNMISLCLLKQILSGLPGIQPFLEDSQNELFLDVSIQTLQRGSVLAVVKTIVCLAACIQQLPSGFDHTSACFTTPLDVLRRCYLESAEALLAPDEGIVSTVDGVQCLLVLVRYHLNAGFPRKAWVVFRRALTFAQLLGDFHRWSSGGLSNAQRQAMWFQLWQSDKMISILLGLPDAVSRPPFINCGLPGSSSYQPLPPKLALILSLGNIGKCIIDRNQQEPKNMIFSDSLRIDLELGKSEEIMPMTWWHTIPDDDMSLEAIHEMFTLKLSYFNLRKLIHLPFVLQPFTNPSYQSSAATALAASREMITCYEILRNEKRPVLRMCNLIDFQAFTAGVIILLITLAYPSFYQDDDWEIVYRLIQVLDRTSQEYSNGVATQASQLLKDLSKFQNEDGQNNRCFQAVVPYFGKMRIRRNGTQTLPITHLPPQHDYSISGSPSAGTHDYLVPELNIDYQRYSQAVDWNAWGEAGQEWTSTIDLGLQEDWDWTFGNADTEHQNTASLSTAQPDFN